MNMLELTRQPLEDKGALTPTICPTISAFAKAIPNETVPLDMKAVISVTQLIVYASQFRRNIAHWDGIEVPINTISFVIKGSGAGGDSSVSAVRRCFSDGYETLLAKRDQIEIQRAQKIAASNDEDPSMVHAPEIYEKYMRSLPPVDIMPTTGPGLIQHINDISDLELSAGMLYTG